MRRLLYILCALALSFATRQASASLFDWNLMVRHDLYSTSEVDGSALIGGDLRGTSNYAVHGVNAPTGDGLVVGGNVASGYNVQINNGGNLRIAGSVGAGTNANLNGGGQIVFDPTVPLLVDDVFRQVESISSSLSSLASNGTLDGAGNMNATPVLLDGQNVAVYNLTSNQLRNLGQLNLNFGAADSVIINVAADSNGAINLIAPPNIIGGFSQSNSSRILWNLYDATSVKINNSLSGALLAPYADLQLLGGGINGAVAVDSFSRMQAEVRRYSYEGYVPEPGAIVLFGLGALTLLRRKR